MQKIRKSIIAIIIIAGVLGVYRAAPVVAQEQTECNGPGCGEQAPPGSGIDQEEYDRYWAQQRALCREFWEEAERRQNLQADQLQGLPPLTDRRAYCLRTFGTRPKPPPAARSSSQPVPKTFTAPSPTPPDDSDSSGNTAPATPPGSGSSGESGPRLSPLHGLMGATKTPLSYAPDINPDQPAKLSAPTSLAVPDPIGLTDTITIEQSDFVGLDSDPFCALV